jgi:protein-disulfide isomerase
LIVEQPLPAIEQPTADLPAKPAASAPAAATPSAYANPNAVLVIPRVVFNYVLIAIVFFALGFGVSAGVSSALFNANSAENKALINDTVSQVLKERGAAVAQQEGLNPNQRYNISVDDDPAWGPTDAAVTIVEFSDFNCPFCSRFHQESYSQIKQNYGDKVRFVYRDFPIVQLHPYAEIAAQAANCANDQGKYWDYHDLLLQNYDKSTRNDLEIYAKQLSLDMNAFKQCVDSGKHKQEIQKDIAEGTEYGVEGTPTLFINGRPVIGAQPYAIFAKYIDEELSKAADSKPQ